MPVPVNMVHYVLGGKFTTQYSFHYYPVLMSSRFLYIRAFFASTSKSHLDRPTMFSSITLKFFCMMGFTTASFRAVFSLYVPVMAMKGFTA